jgi:hypothetical protein
MPISFDLNLLTRLFSAGDGDIWFISHDVAFREKSRLVRSISQPLRMSGSASFAGVPIAVGVLSALAQRGDVQPKVDGSSRMGITVTL